VSQRGRSHVFKSVDLAECGAGFTQKLEVMFKDMELSADVMQAYQATAAGSRSPSKSGDSFDLSVAVLSQGNWPTYPPFPIALPPSLTSALDRFKSFYVSKHSGRTITWAHGLDTCSLRATFPSKGKGGGRKELMVSLAQAVVLLLFNDVGDAKLSVEEIGEATKLGALARTASPSSGFFSRRLARTDQVESSVSLAQTRRSSTARSSLSRAAKCACSSSTRKDATSTRATTSHLTRCAPPRSVLAAIPFLKSVQLITVSARPQDFKDDHVRIKINQIQQKETVRPRFIHCCEFFSRRRERS
jgi:hypothetical protein